MDIDYTRQEFCFSIFLLVLSFDSRLNDSVSKHLPMLIIAECTQNSPSTGTNEVVLLFCAIYLNFSWSIHLFRLVFTCYLTHSMIIDYTRQEFCFSIFLLVLSFDSRLNGSISKLLPMLIIAEYTWNNPSTGANEIVLLFCVISLNIS